MGVTNAKAGLRLNGIIESYVAGSGGINAGDFTKHVNGGYGSVHKISSLYGHHMSAVALDSTRVFVAYTDGDAHLWGIVCTISGTGITTGTEIEINAAYYAGYAISAILLDSTHVFIAHGNYTLYSVICTISGTTITIGPIKTIDDSPPEAIALSAVKLTETKVFIAYSYYNSSVENSFKLYGVVCTVSGTNIISGLNTVINSSDYSGNFISATALSSTSVFIHHSSFNGTYAYNHVVVCTISGATITAGTDVRGTTIPAIDHNNTVALSAVTLDPTHVFIAHTSNADQHFLASNVCTVSGTTISIGPNYYISNIENSGLSFSVLALDASNVVVYHHAPSSTATLYYVNVGISGTSISVGTDTLLVNDSHAAANNPSAAVVGSFGTIFVAFPYSSSTDIYGIVKSYDSVVTVSSSSDTILGVSKQTKNEGETVDVIVPNV